MRTSATSRRRSRAFAGSRPSRAGRSVSGSRRTWRERERLMDRNLALEVARVTEAAALASARFMGRGDEAGADQAAVESMRRAFNAIPVTGKVVIGEGTHEQTAALYVGEQVGSG